MLPILCAFSLLIQHSQAPERLASGTTLQMHPTDCFKIYRRYRRFTGEPYHLLVIKDLFLKTKQEPVIR